MAVLVVPQTHQNSVLLLHTKRNVLEFRPFICVIVVCVRCRGSTNMCVCVCGKMKETQPTSLLLQPHFPFIRTSRNPLVLIHLPFPVSLLLFTHINPHSRLFPHLTPQQNWSAVLLSTRAPSTCLSICLLVQSFYATYRLYQPNFLCIHFINILSHFRHLSYSLCHCALRLVLDLAFLSSQKRNSSGVRNFHVACMWQCVTPIQLSNIFIDIRKKMLVVSCL